MHKTQKGQDKNLSARLVPTLGKSILDHPVECHTPTTPTTEK